MTVNIIDMHAHILPGIDDGARTVEESCKMLETAAEQGVVSVIATPHDVSTVERTQLEQTMEALQEHMRKIRAEFSLYLGQETCYHEELVEELRQGKALTMAGSRYVLVEFRTEVPYSMMTRGIRQLQLAGYHPILAHMERYTCLRKDASLDELIQSGCKLQMNYESLEGRGLFRDVRWCRKQVVQGRIHLLGSDMHRMDYRPPRIDKALQWLERHTDTGILERMISVNPSCILKNQYMD